MSKPNQCDIAKAVLDRHGTTFGEDLSLHVERNAASALFQALNFAVLSSARIGSQIAFGAAKNLKRHGLTTPQKMAEASWDDRVKVLNEAGYARYQERTSTMFGDTAEMLLDTYGGDLRRLRDEAERDPKRERELLKEVKGIGDVGVDIFFREAQVAWEELAPFLDKKTADAAEKLGLPKTAGALAELAPRGQYPRLAAGIIKTQLEGDADAVREAAAS